MFFVVALAFALSWCLLAVLLNSGLAGRLALDQPNHRSLHQVAIPRIGGIGILAGILAGLGARTVLSPLPSLSPLLWLALAIGGALAVLSFLDDRWGVPILIRLCAHLAAAAIWVDTLAGWPPVSAAFAIILLVWMTNLYNFMDGADGLAGGMAVSGFSAYAAAAWLAGQTEFALLCAAVATASLAFLRFNFPPARVFMGDVGSVPLGFLAGALGLLGWRQGLWPAWFPLLVFSPFCVDATLTLLRRILSGKRFWQAHSEHYYQRLVHLGWSQRRTALTAYALMLASAASALGLAQADGALHLPLLAGWALAYGLLAWRIDAAWRERAAIAS